MHVRVVSPWIAVAVLYGCDAQVGSSYGGEPLMTFRGSVVASETPLHGDLTPLFFFPKAWSHAMPPTYFWWDYYVRGEVHGSFPNSFTMTVYDPAPAEVLLPLFTGEAALALGTITAASPSFPNWLRYDWERVQGGAPASLERANGEARYHVCSDTGQCLHVDDFCVNGQHGSHLQFPCGPRYPDGYPWQRFGVAERHAILFLATPAAPGSYTARYFGAEQGIPAGYHVLTMDPTWKELSDEISPRVQALNVCGDERYFRLREEIKREWGLSEEQLLRDGAAWDEIKQRTLRDEVDHPCAGDQRYRLAPEKLIELSLFNKQSSSLDFAR